MKIIILFALTVGFISQTAVAQIRTVDRHFELSRNEKIKLHLKFGQTINIKSWNKKMVSFKASIEINRGTLNDALQLRFDEDGEQLKITSDYDTAMINESHYSGACRGNGYSKYSVGGDERHYTVCARISYQVFVPRGADVKVRSISGNITLADLSGPVDAKSISGFVDLSRSQKAKANLNLKTTTGQVYTDFDIKAEDKKRSVTGAHVKGNLRGGGPLVRLKSVSGNIYLRKTDS